VRRWAVFAADELLDRPRPPGDSLSVPYSAPGGKTCKRRLPGPLTKADLDVVSKMAALELHPPADSLSVPNWNRGAGRMGLGTDKLFDAPPPKKAEGTAGIWGPRDDGLHSPL
jgi:hypothetical protein